MKCFEFSELIILFPFFNFCGGDSSYSQSWSHLPFLLGAPILTLALNKWMIFLRYTRIQCMLGFIIRFMWSLRLILSALEEMASQRLAFCLWEFGLIQDYTNSDYFLQYLKKNFNAVLKWDIRQYASLSGLLASSLLLSKSEFSFCILASRLLIKVVGCLVTSKCLSLSANHLKMVNYMYSILIISVD